MWLTKKLIADARIWLHGGGPSASWRDADYGKGGSYRGFIRNTDWIAFLVLPVAVTVHFFLIADFDSPRGGAIRVAPPNLSSLSQYLPGAIGRRRGDVYVTVMKTIEKARTGVIMNR